jgi:hypothetical protein
MEGSRPWIKSSTRKRRENLCTPSAKGDEALRGNLEKTEQVKWQSYILCRPPVHKQPFLISIPQL